MDGSAKTTFSPSIDYVGDSIEDALEVKLLGGTYTDEDKLGFSYEIISISPSGMDFQFTFDDPLEISQNEDPERIEIVLNLQNFTRDGSQDMSGLLKMRSFIPR